MPTWFCIPEIYPDVDRSALWDGTSDVQRWRYMRRSTICTMLGLARTAYLTRNPREDKRIGQRILLDVRNSRPK